MRHETKTVYSQYIVIIQEMLRLLYCRSNRLVRLFRKCIKNVVIELCRSFCTTF